MKFENINIKNDRKRVLVAPLDWGLGHATRCIPIIYALIKLKFEVIIAADGYTRELLKKEFPNVVFTQLRGYNIRYSSHKIWFPVTLVVQFPKLLYCIYYERVWLKKIIAAHHISAVISDNRPGLYHSKIPCIYITHQLKIKTGNRFTEWLAQKAHYFFINKYKACWVPDNQSANNLAGELSHPKILPKIPVKYIGPLSRFEKITVEKKYDLLIILSGPEPQRTIFEELLMKELKGFSGTAFLVRGLPGNVEKEGLVFNGENKISIINHLSAGELSTVIQQSDMVISRSGYTTVMDLVKLHQKAILVPTPGQTEQEYLAENLMMKKMFFSIPQNSFSLNEALVASKSFPFINTFLFWEIEIC